MMPLEYRGDDNMERIMYLTRSCNFFKIPGNPIAYWWSNNLLDCFSSNNYIGGNPMKGIQTGNGDKYLRFWFEVSNLNTGYNLKNYYDIRKTKQKWFPITSGGVYRKWYGNFELIVNLENDGYDIKSSGLNNYRLKDPKYYFQEGLTWTEVTTKPFNCRYLPSTILFGNGGPVIFELSNELFFTIGLLNSIVAREIFTVLAPTMNFGPDQVRNMPLKKEQEAVVEKIVENNIFNSKIDWDSFETSWDFKKHPLI